MRVIDKAFVKKFKEIKEGDEFFRPVSIMAAGKDIHHFGERPVFVKTGPYTYGAGAMDAYTTLPETNVVLVSSLPEIFEEEESA